LLNAIETLAAYRAGKTAPVEVIETALAAIKTDPTNAWVHIAAAGALKAAQASEARWRRNEPQGLLDGIPIGVKDLVAVTGQPMRRGSLAFPADYSPAHGITRNPYNSTRTAGGSSGGSAAALALGHVPITIGTDGGGSIRVPAAYCGVFGMKPSTGRIAAPIGPFWPHAVTGPMSRSVRDTALAWNVATLPDPRDPYMFPGPGIDWLAETQRGVGGLRIAVASRFDGVGASPEITAALHQAADVLANAGAIGSAAEPAWPCNPLASFMVFWRSMYAASVALLPPPEPRHIDPVIKRLIAAAAPITRHEFQAAIQQRDMLALAMAKFHASYDLLLCPVMPCQPWEAGRATPRPFAEDDWSWCPFAYPFNLTRQPAASVPFGTDRNGMPLAVQIVAAAGQDSLVLRAAQQIAPG
jgi:aspartyl-tRNA(Asn)/glutamyl-tRNA(Gln) amidotransferase subunit A